MINSSNSLMLDENILKPLMLRPLSLDTVKFVAKSSDSIFLALLFCKFPIPPKSEDMLIEVPVPEFKFLKPPPNL